MQYNDLQLVLYAFKNPKANIMESVTLDKTGEYHIIDRRYHPLLIKSIEHYNERDIYMGKTLFFMFDTSSEKDNVIFDDTFMTTIDVKTLINLQQSTTDDERGSIFTLIFDSFLANSHKHSIVDDKRVNLINLVLYAFKGSQKNQYYKLSKRYYANLEHILEATEQISIYCGNTLFFEFNINETEFNVILNRSIVKTLPYTEINKLYETDDKKERNELFTFLFSEFVSKNIGCTYIRGNVYDYNKYYNCNKTINQIMNDFIESGLAMNNIYIDGDDFIIDILPTVEKQKESMKKRYLILGGLGLFGLGCLAMYRLLKDKVKN